MAKKISEADLKELIAKKAINMFNKRSGRGWDAKFHEVFTLIECYLEAREKVGRGRTAKK